MTEQDIRAWERETNHAQKMQEQRKRQELKEGSEGKQNKSKTITFAGGHSYEVPEAIYSNEIYLAKDNDNEIN